MVCGNCVCVVCVCVCVFLHVFLYVFLMCAFVHQYSFCVYKSLYEFSFDLVVDGGVSSLLCTRMCGGVV